MTTLDAEADRLMDERLNVLETSLAWVEIERGLLEMQKERLISEIQEIHSQRLKEIKTIKSYQ